ncbi:hypothetical protein OROGR_024051 [Orobanche gracilis]
MAGRRGGAPTELKDFQIGCSWIPTTPAKPNSTAQQPICRNWQANSPIQHDWAESGRYTPFHLATQPNWCGPGELPGDYARITQCHTAPACYNSPTDLVCATGHSNNWQAAHSSVLEQTLSNFDTWQANEAAGSRDFCGAPTEKTENWASNMSFQKLLALADAGGNKAAISDQLTDKNFVFRPQTDSGLLENVVRHGDITATSSSYCAPLFHTPTESVRYTLSDGNSGVQDPFNLFGATFGAELDISSVLTGADSNPYRHSFDLNTPARTFTNAAFSESIPFQFEPVTPQKTINAEYGQGSPVIDLSIYEVPIGGDADKNKIIINQLSTGMSTQLQEEVDLTKTPQLKTRRKKHRPKVIIEGQQKRTPKSRVENPPGSQETTTVKRKYVRKKGVTDTLGGEINGTELNKKEPSSTDTPIEKRKHVRRKGVDKPEDDVDKETTETTNVKASRVTRSSCRRSLNFNSDGQTGHESSSQCPSSNSVRESQAEGNSYPMKNSMLGDQTVCTRRKCQIVFSDATHDKEMNTVHAGMNPDDSRTPKTPSDFMWSSTCLTPERHVRGLKRQNVCTTAESEICNRNEIGTFYSYNSLQAYLPIFPQNADKNNGSPGLHFPIIYKKKRTNMITSGSQLAASTACCHMQLDVHALGDSSSGQFQVPNLLTTNHAIGGTQNGQNFYENLLALRPTEKIRKKRSIASTRLRNLDSLLEICRQLPASTSRAKAESRMKQNITILREAPTCMEVRVAGNRTTMTTRKRTKRIMSTNSMVQNLYNCRKSATVPKAPPLTLTWRCVSHIDTIIEQLNQLDLNAERSRTSAGKQNAFMAYHTHYQQQHAIVPFQRSVALIPFDGSHDQVRRRRPRPKVDLDDETTRVWKLLLENINSEGIDGTDEEKTKWWEEERRVFNGRADSFIARMHLVQGDRRFSPWKGSVVDSVVGVFLTQNVSDHLSSSAFMSMAARFPLKSKTQTAGLHEKKLGIEEVYDLDLDGIFSKNGNILNQSVCGDDTEMHQYFEGNIRRETNHINTFENSSEGFILKGKLGGQSPDTLEHGPVLFREIAADKSVSLIEDGRDAEDTLSSQTPETSSQCSSNSPIAQTTERSDSCLPSTSEDEPTGGTKANWLNSSTSVVELLQRTDTVVHGVYDEGSDKINLDGNRQSQSKCWAVESHNEGHLLNPMFPAEIIAPSSKSTLCHAHNSGSQATVSDLSKQTSKFFNCCDKEPCSADVSDLSSGSASGTTFQKVTDVSYKAEPKLPSTNATSSNSDQGEISQKRIENKKGQVPAQSLFQDNNKMQEVSKSSIQILMDVTGSSSKIDNSKNPAHKEVNSNKDDSENHHSEITQMVDGSKAKGGKPRKEKENQVDWDHLRKQRHADGTKSAKTANTMDSVDWDAVRCADVDEVAQTIRDRGMNNVLAGRIKDFLTRLVRDHGSIDLEWLRDVPPDKAKEYLLSIRGLGLKSVECVRLLTLHHLAFPVDTNVGRIAVRLGWVPLQPLPESLQLHLLELYPVLESIQKYLWPRLCKLDQRTLYELHYQMITFGKVFCTKSKPNCNACPMRGECRHFASAFASARLALPAPEEKSIVSATENRKADQNPMRRMNTLRLPSPETNQINARFGVSNSQPIIEEPSSPEPIIEVPATPEQDYAQVLQCDIENAFDEDPDEIPTIQLNMEEFTHNLQKIMQQNTELQEGNVSKALVALTSAAASIPVPKLKNVNRLRTEHQVYELPDSHPLLEGMEKREPDDPCPYLLAIWTPGETADSIEPPERRCCAQELEKLCTDETCSSCNSIREANSQTVRGTLLIPCRTAMRGSFPLNGTYFQVNEVFTDHESSLSPIDVPREWLWNLPRRTVYFGTSIPTIFKGLSTEGIQYCFWRGTGLSVSEALIEEQGHHVPSLQECTFPQAGWPKEKGRRVRTRQD